MQLTTTFKFSTINSFIDEAFDIKEVNRYSLHLQLELTRILAAVYDSGKNKFIAFEQYTTQHCFEYQTLADGLALVMHQSKLLPHKYKAVKCILVNNLSTLVPTALYDEERKKLFLKFNYPLQGDEMVCDNKLNSFDSYNVFALPFAIKSRIEMLYNLSKVSYYHFTSCLLDLLLSHTKNQTDKRLFVHVQEQHLEIVIIENNKLLFSNSFNYFSAEDFMYYLLFVCEQMQLNPEKISTFLVGEIERNSNLFALIQKYVRTVTLLNRLSDVEYSYQLQTLPAHSYFTLLTNYYK